MFPMEVVSQICLGHTDHLLVAEQLQVSFLIFFGYLQVGSSLDVFIGQGLALLARAQDGMKK